MDPADQYLEPLNVSRFRYGTYTILDEIDWNCGRQEIVILAKMEKKGTLFRVR
jgi:hypothetical protein